MKNKNQKSITLNSDPKKVNLYIKISIVLLTLFLFGQTINFEFTLDDNVVFIQNNTVAKGISAIPQIFSENSFKGYFGAGNIDPIYRPITLTTFAIQKDISGFNPKISHFLNIMLYTLCGLILFSFLKNLFNKWPTIVCGAIALLFIAHPIHTEVVCSVKSRDELLGCLFGLLSLRALLIHHTSDSTFKSQLIAPFWMLLALFSKESTIALIGIIPILLYFKYETDLKKIIRSTFPFLIVAGVFLLARHFALSVESVKSKDLLINNSINAATTFSQIYGTKMYILFYTLKQVAIPYPLSYDYSFNQIPVLELFSLYPVISIVLHLLLLYMMIRLFKAKDPISFGILFFFATTAITNNFFIQINATFAERFLFLGSIGFLIFMASGLIRLQKIEPAIAAKNKSIRSIFFVLFSLYSIISFARIPDWKNNFELYKSGVISAPNSAKTYSALGTAYLDKAKNSTDMQEKASFLNEAKINFSRSIDILPSSFDSYYNLGVVSILEGDTISSIIYNKKCIEIESNYRNAYHNLALIYSNKNENDSALFYLEKISPTVVNYALEYPIYSFIYLQKKDFQKAKYYAEKGVQEDPNSLANYKNLVAAYLNMGDTSNASYYYNRYRELGGN